MIQKSSEIVGWGETHYEWWATGPKKTVMLMVETAGIQPTGD